MSLIPITTLTPARDPPTDKAIRGIVTLFWPYSSSTRQCAFLLADPDFRLRSKQGQVRVRFTGASAEAVAKSHVGIGDEVVLGLEGARWEEDPEATRTPGRSVDGELFYRRKLRLVLKREVGDARVDVDAPASPPRVVEQDSAQTWVTPAPKAVQKLRGRDVGQGYTYTSPAFVKRLRLSEESAFDSFAIEDMDVDMDAEGENRRTSFGRGMKWRYAAKTPSPTKATAPTLDTSRSGDESPSRKAKTRIDTIISPVDEGPTSNMLPPPRPRLQLTSASASNTAEDDQEAPSTPKLLPVTSPTLPLPSPFPADRGSQLQDDSLVAKSTTKDQTDDYTAQLIQSQDDEIMTDVPHSQQDVLLPQPRTPAKAPLTAGFGFGFDGAATSPPAPQKTSPQDEEKQRVMAQTFRSLFGFTGSSQAQVSERNVAPSQTATEQTPPLSELEQQRLGAGRTIEKETAAVRNQPASAVEASSSQLAEDNEKSASEFVGSSSDFVFSVPLNIPKIEERSAPEAALPETQSLTSQPLPEIEKAAASAMEVPLRQTSQPLHQQSREAPEIIEIESSSEDEDEDDVANLKASDVRWSAREGPDTYQDSQAEGLMPSQLQEREIEASQTSQAQASSDSFRVLQHERMNDGLLKSFIQPEHLYATLPPPVEPPREPSELEMKTTSPEAPLDEEELSQQATMTDSSRQQPSYPSLPLSPSNSQSIQGMASQAIPETMHSLLPPTPQLTQAESSASYLHGMLGTQAPGSQDQRAEDAADHKIIAAGSLVTYPPLQHDASGIAAPGPQLDSAVAENDVEVNISEPVDQIQAGTQPPSTEQVKIREEGAGTRESAPIEQPPAEAQSRPAEQIDTGRITRAKAKKAAAGRASSIPDAISSYFSPRRSSTAAAVTNGAPEPLIAVEPETNGHHVSEAKYLTHGFSTALSYFTPLSHLDSLLNPSSSQQAFGSTNAVDVLAVVTDNTTDPVQAKAGPRDHYIIFRITDSSLNPSPNASVRVEVFRPYKDTLPRAKEGDVVLLRAFAVKSRKRQPYLISSDASAWCVFSFSELSTAKDKPKWALKASEGAKDASRFAAGLSEMVPGPPVEFGDEERQRAKDLRNWWDSSHGHDSEVHEANGVNESSATAGREPVVAKL